MVLFVFAFRFRFSLVFFESKSHTTKMSDDVEMDDVPVSQNAEMDDDQLSDDDVVVKDEWTDVTNEKDGGVMKKIITEGSGWEKPEKGAEVTVHYTGTLEDGTKFDSSRDRDEPFKFKLGEGQVIKGWDLGVKTMKKGERATLKIQSQYGYGSSGSPPKIPGGATLLFDVELISWTSWKDVSEARDGTIMKRILTAGEGYQNPNDLSQCKIHYKVSYLVPEAFGQVVTDAVVFDTHSLGRTFDFISGEEQVPYGLDHAVQSMKKGEVAVFHIDHSHLFGGAGYQSAEFSVPENTSLQYTVELVDFEKGKETWSLSTEEKIETAKTSKEEGNKFFNDGKLKLAQKRYKRALSCIEYGSFDDHQKEEVKKLKLVLYLNISAVAVKQKMWKDVTENTKKALEIEPANPKALFRQGQALVGRGDLEDALSVLNKALAQNQESKEIKREVDRVKKLLKNQEEKDKNLYGKMFSRGF